MSPATPEQLKTRKRIIYGILNRHNGRWYVGQTRNTFNKRYAGGQWWEKTSNPLLRKSYRRHGFEAFEAFEAFEVYIFVSEIETDDLMDKLEKQYIIQYDALFPKGYCFEEGGQQYGKRINESSKAKLSKVHCKRSAKEYVLLDGDNKECRFTNISTFAKEHGLDPRSLANVIRGGKKYHRYKGYHRVDTDLRKFHQQRPSKIVIDPQGIEYTVYNIAAFCREHGLAPSPFNRILTGKRWCYRGWQFKTDGVKAVGDKWRNEHHFNKRYERIVLEREGELFVISNDIAGFCEKYNLSKTEIYGIVAGRHKMAHGFRLVSVVYTSSYLAAHPEPIVI